MKSRRKNLLRSHQLLFAILAMFLSLSASAQQITASGEVVDEQQEPLIGVSVQEKGTGNWASIAIHTQETVHSFTLSFKIKGAADGVVASFINGSNTGTLAVKDGAVVYSSPLTGKIKSEVHLSNNQWYVVSLMHYYAQGCIFILSTYNQ